MITDFRAILNLAVRRQHLAVSETMQSIVSDRCMLTAVLGLSHRESVTYPPYNPADFLTVARLPRTRMHGHP